MSPDATIPATCEKTLPAIVNSWEPMMPLSGLNHRQYSERWPDSV